ncbi:TolC family protein [Oleispirillum naphthae]|uniref:TolC family protein n=1 Tax=Oleispirillum naphthae TaxID=2838853 RepID=UPI0030826740
MKKILLAAMALAAVAGCSMQPEPLSPAEIADAVGADAKTIADSEEPLAGPLDLPHSMARAVKFNLQHRLLLMEQALAQRSFELAKMDMLPVLAGTGSYTDRNNFNASSSENVITHQQSLVPSYSEDRARWTVDARFSWNILDFGVSYLQARQESNRFLVATLARRKTMEKLVQQVRTSFWRAAVMQQITPEVDELQERATTALVALQQIRSEQLRAPLATLEDIRALMEISQQLEALRQSASAAQTDLAQLINLRPDKNVSLDIPAELPPLPFFQPDFPRMEDRALVNSSDYTAEIYKERVDRDESRKALLRLMPGVELFKSITYDSNSFLWSNNWETAGARVNWNIMRVLSLPDITDNNEARTQVAQARRLATHMAVITKVHLAWQRYADTMARLDRAQKLDNLDSDIVQLSAQALESEATSGIADLKNRMRGLRSRVTSSLAYAEAQDAFALFLQSLGVHPIPDDYQHHSVDDLAAHIGAEFDRYTDGALTDLASPTAEGTPVTPSASTT